MSEEMIAARARVKGALIGCRKCQEADGRSTDWDELARVAVDAAIAAYNPNERLREAAAIGLEYVIEAANVRKTKDAVFENAMRDIARIESALSPLPQGED